MKISTLVILLLTVFVLVLGVAVVAADDINQRARSTEALNAPISGGINNLAPGLFTTGFEAVDGFFPGSCDGQNGWSYGGYEPASGEISTANPATGQQHLRMNKDTTADPGEYTGCYTTNGTGGSDVSFDVALHNPDNTTVYSVAVFSGPTNSGEMTFNWDGVIYVADGSGFVVNTGVFWIPNAYVPARIERTATNVNYYYNGALVIAKPIFGGPIDEIDIVTDNWDIFDYADFDNLRVEDPTAVGLNDLSGSNATTMLPLAVATLLGLLSIAVVVGSKRNKQTI